MKIRIMAIGKLKDPYLRDACADYQNRLGKYADIEIDEFPDLPTGDNPSETAKEETRRKECAKLLLKIKPRDFVVLLDLGSKQMDSRQLSKTVEKWFSIGGSEITFVIGGSLGLSEEMKKRGNATLTLSELTFTHGFARVLLLEQLYRSFKIMKNEPYDK